MSEQTIITWERYAFLGMLVLWLLIGIRQYQKRRNPTILILLGLFVCWQFYREYAWGMKPPPVYADSLPEFMNHVTTSDYRITFITTQTMRYFILTGSWSLLAMAKTGFLLGSGPPAYVFNQKGELIGWTRDFAEDSSFWNRWAVVRNSPKPGRIAKEISVEEALALVKQWPAEPPQKR
jgi:hypothetical protein